MPLSGWLGQDMMCRVGVLAVVGIGFVALVQHFINRCDLCGTVHDQRGRMSMTQLRNLCWRSRPRMGVFHYLLHCFRGSPCSDTVVVLRTANPSDAALYHTLLMPLQQQLKCPFTVVVESVTEFDKMLVVEVCTRRYYEEHSSADPETYIDADTSGGGSARPTLTTTSDDVSTAAAAAAASALASTVSSLFHDDDGGGLVLCRIPLPDQRVYRDIPSVVPRLIAAHAENARLFSSYAEELLFYLPIIEEFNRNYQEEQQKQKHHHHLLTSATTGTPLSPVGMHDGYMEGSRDRGWPAPIEGPVVGTPQLHARCGDSVISALLGYLIDINATMFSTSLLVEFGDSATGVGSGVCGCSSVSNLTEDQFIYNAIHEALFHVVLRTPLARPDISAMEKLRMHPFKVWRASRRSRRAAAELYVLDVAAAKGDQAIFHSRVVDEVVAQAVLVHHAGSLAEFVDALHARFGLVYAPVIPALRRVVEWRFGATMGQQHHDEDHGAVGGNFSTDTVDDIALRKETREDVLRELPHTTEFILEHRIRFYNAMLTTSGSNQLEEVFGVPATVFPFLQCARGSVAFVTQVFDCIVSVYGPLNFHNFTKYAHDVFVRDRPEIVRHAPRIFRMLNKTRTGVISFEELCCWMARKLSSGSLLRPDAHLIAIAMSLRLPLALLIDKKQQWFRKECALASLSDADTDGY